MKKRVLLPLFFSLSISGCAGSPNNQKGPMDRDQALLSLVRYRELQKVESYVPPKTLKLRSSVDELTFHETELREAKIELQVDTEYVNGEKNQIFPYGHFVILASKMNGGIYAYESWVFVESRSAGDIVNVYERGTELENNIRREYVFESKRDWTDKATDCLDSMNSIIYNTPDKISSTIKEIAKETTIITEGYNETSSSNLNGDITYKTEESERNELTFKFEDYCLKSYAHKIGNIKNETTAVWNASIEQDRPEPALFVLEGEGLTKAIR